MLDLAINVSFVGRLVEAPTQKALRLHSKKDEKYEKVKVKKIACINSRSNRQSSPSEKAYPSHKAGETASSE